MQDNHIGSRKALRGVVTARRIKCELCSVVILDEAGNRAELTIPAYTVECAELTERVVKALVDYTIASTEAGQGMSLADFALMLLTHASRDPRTMPYDQERAV